MIIDMNDFIDFVRDELGEKHWVPLYKNLNKEDETEDGTLFSCLVLPENTNKAMESNGWDLLPGSGGPSIVQSDHIRYEPNSSEHLPLIIYRDFHGTRKPYKEILQELVLYLGLYHDQDNSKYVVDNDNGGEIEVIRYSDKEIVIRKSFLTAFMSARQMDFLLFFEKTRHENANEISPDEDVKEQFISFTRYDGASYVNGYSTFSRVLGKKVFFCPPREDKYYSPLGLEDKYESFIVDGDNYDNTLHSCNPKLLANNFGDNKDAPNYLTPIYFEKTVLQKYFGASTEYEVRDSVIHKHGYWTLRFDNNAPEYVCVFLGDLGRDIPNSEQTYWKSFNLPPEGKSMSKTYFTRSILGDFSDAESPDLVFKLFFQQFQDKWLTSKGWHLFLPLVEADEHCFKTLHSLTKNEQSEFDSQILSLIKITVDSINVKELKKHVCVEEGDKGIKILTKFLSNANVDFDVQTFLGGLQGVRSTGVAHRRGTKYENTIARLGIEDDKLIMAFDNILGQMTNLLREVDKVFL